MRAGPGLVVVVAGTGTEVGKTWVTCALARALRADGRSVSVRKPAQSFGPGTPETETDAYLLASATGEEVTSVCPPHRWYERALAPPMAAASMGRGVPRLSELLAELRWPTGPEVGLVELAGGVGSPQAADGDGAALVAAVRPGLVVLVSPAGLGAINDVRLCVMALRGGPPVVVFLNRFDPVQEVHWRNRDWLSAHDGLDVVTTVATLARRVGTAVPRPSN